MSEIGSMKIGNFLMENFSMTFLRRRMMAELRAGVRTGSFGCLRDLCVGRLEEIFFFSDKIL